MGILRSLARLGGSVGMLPFAVIKDTTTVVFKITGEDDKFTWSTAKTLGSVVASTLDLANPRKFDPKSVREINGAAEFVLDEAIESLYYKRKNGDKW